MGREVRRVPKDWVHPEGQPMFDSSFRQAADEWEAGYEKWLAGERPDYCDGENRNMRFWEWEGNPPDPKDYMPEFEEGTRTHYQMYEDTSKGTPISPVMETPEELARWLADTGASSFGTSTATYEQWLSVCQGGWAPSAVYSPSTGLISGVEAISALSEPPE